MIVTDALIVIALCLAVLAAIGVRNALSLRDIGVGLERLAQALEAEGLPGRARATPGTPGTHAPPDGQEAALPAQAGTDEAEIAAAIAAAAKAVGRSGGLTGRSR